MEKEGRRGGQSKAMEKDSTGTSLAVQWLRLLPTQRTWVQGTPFHGLQLSSRPATKDPAFHNGDPEGHNKTAQINKAK